jgi:GNAT superfamily N-acetyltransferase
MIAIFNAGLVDADLIAELFVENVDETYITASEEIWNRARLKDGWNENLYNNVKEEILEGVKSKDKLILVMYDQDKLIGYTFTAFKNNFCAELEDFVIHRDYRRDGFGKKLYDKTIEMCKLNNIKTLFLEVGVDNLKMHNFCKRNSLKPTSTRYWQDLNEQT